MIMLVVIFASGCTPESSQENKAMMVAIPIDKQAMESGEIIKSQDSQSDKVHLSSEIYGRNDPFDRLIASNFNNSNSQTQNSGLSGIIWSAENPLAIINGKVVKIGDKTSLGKVAAIEPGMVVVEDEIGRYEFKLGK